MKEIGRFKERYCLLSWENNPVGLSYEESEEFAQEFYNWIKTNSPELEFNFSYGYSMDMPQMFRAIDFMKFYRFYRRKTDAV